MGRAMDSEDTENKGAGPLGDAIDEAAHNAQIVGQLADLKIGSSQLFLQTTEQTRMALCIADPHQDDCPIV